MSSWNLPPGVTTNDLPGNRPDDLDPEDLEPEYIKQCGERMAWTIAETWSDAIVLHECYNRARKRDNVLLQIVAALNANMSKLEIAETAAELVGNPSFEQWLQEQNQ